MREDYSAIFRNFKWMVVERHLCTCECAAAAEKILREKLGLSGTLYYMLSALEYQAAGSMYFCHHTRQHDYGRQHVIR
jgi:hypothetical protein